MKKLIIVDPETLDEIHITNPEKIFKDVTTFTKEHTKDNDKKKVNKDENK